MNDYGHRSIRAAIDAADHDHPRCTHCGAPTVVVARDDQLWLECSEGATPMSRLRRLVFGIHDSHHVADLPDGVRAR